MVQLSNIDELKAYNVKPVAGSTDEMYSIVYSCVNIVMMNDPNRLLVDPLLEIA